MPRLKGNSALHRAPRVFGLPQASERVRPRVVTPSELWVQLERALGEVEGGVGHTFWVKAERRGCTSELGLSAEDTEGKILWMESLRLALQPPAPAQEQDAA